MEIQVTLLALGVLCFIASIWCFLRRDWMGFTPSVSIFVIAITCYLEFGIKVVVGLVWPIGSTVMGFMVVVLILRPFIKSTRVNSRLSKHQLTRPKSIDGKRLSSSHLDEMFGNSYPPIPILKTNKTYAPLSANMLDRGEGFRAKGMSHFNSNFVALRNKLRVSTSTAVATQVQLVHDPFNAHSPTAIALEYGGLRLGYVPDAESELFYNVLQKADGRVFCEVEIWFDNINASPPRNSITIFSRVPPTIR